MNTAIVGIIAAIAGVLFAIFGFKQRSKLQIKAQTEAKAATKAAEVLVAVAVADVVVAQTEVTKADDAIKAAKPVELSPEEIEASLKGLEV